MIGAVYETGKVGTLTVKVNVKKEGTQAVAHCDITAKLPEPPLPGTMFFFDKEGKSIQRDDPRQLTLKSLIAPTPLRTISNSEGDEDDEDDEDE